MRFTIRDLMLTMAVCGLVIGWVVDRRMLAIRVEQAERRAEAFRSIANSFLHVLDEQVPDWRKEAN
jgi:hypothetical protein